MHCRSLVATCIALALWGAAQAKSPAPPSGAQEIAKLTVALQSRYPDVQILDVQPGPIANLYEVFTGDAVIYSDSTGEHLFVGSLIDTHTRRNLTAERLDIRNSIDFSTLPFDRAIKVVKGTGKRQLAVFADPDCPYCKQLETQLASLTDITIYTFLYPLTEIHPESAQKAHAIWCAPDRSQAWSTWMLESKLPQAAAACSGDPIEELQTLGRQLRIASTPTLFMSTGRRVGGVLPPDQFKELLDASAAPAAAGGASSGTK
jgi:thiol:disulfide interchange protein DsbC